MLSEKLKELRKEHGITQKQFAEIFNVSSGTIAMWETDKRMPDADTIVRIANYFKVSTDYILDITDDPTDYDDPKAVAEAFPEYSNAHSENACSEVVDYFGGDAKKIHDFYAAVDNDAAREYYDKERDDWLHYFGIDYDEEAIIRKYRKLDKHGINAFKKVLNEEYTRCVQNNKTEKQTGEEGA